MIYIFYAAVCLGTIIFQTTILASLPWPGGCYDLLVPFIFYVGIVRPIREGLPLVIILGYVMDTISAGPSGLYGTTYILLLGAARWGIRYFHVESRVFIPLIVAGGVLLENLVYLGSISFSKSYYRLPEDFLIIIAGQVIAALFTGVFIYTGLLALHRAWDRRVAEYMARDKQKSV